MEVRKAKAGDVCGVEMLVSQFFPGLGNIQSSERCGGKAVVEITTGLSSRHLCSVHAKSLFDGLTWYLKDGIADVDCRVGAE